MRRTIVVFLLLGLVSLFADIAYEGARSILGSYLRVLEAIAIIAGAVSIGDFIGYVMRLVSGAIASKIRSSRILWYFTIGGYIINLLAVPALALTKHWNQVLALVILERSGKGIRTPARDVILAEVSESMGRGKGFGIHEAMDQIGAIAGPAIVAFILGTTNNYSLSFIILGIPAVIAIILIVTASLLYPRIRSIEELSREKGVRLGIVKELKTVFWLYIASISILSIGFLHWSLIAFYLKDQSIVSDTFIPILYLIAMAVDAIVAIPIGWLYDRVGFKSLFTAPLIAIPIPLLLFSKEYLAILISVVLWGAVIGIYETIMRATVADIVSPTTRPLAYGVMGFMYGISWMIGSIILGYLYDLSISLVVIFAVVASALSLIPLALAYREIKSLRSTYIHYIS